MSKLTCPDCGGPMVVRMDRCTGNEFLGCAAYPECRGTRETDKPEDRERDELPSERMRRHDRDRWR